MCVSMQCRAPTGACCGALGDVVALLDGLVGGWVGLCEPLLLCLLVGRGCEVVIVIVVAGCIDDETGSRQVTGCLAVG